MMGLRVLHVCGLLGYRTLHGPAQTGQTEKVLELIRKGADPTKKDEDGFTPLHLAAAAGHTETVLALIIDVGVDPDISADIPKLALAFQNVVLKTKSHKGTITPLHLAAATGQSDTARALISKGADLDARTAYGDTPLHKAATEGQTDMAIILIGDGAEVNSRNLLGDATPLHAAAEKGHAITAMELIKQGADPNARKNTSAVDAGWTPLHCAAARGHTQTVLALLSLGAAANVRDRLAYTPYEHAVMGKHMQTAKVIELWIKSPSR